MKNALLVLLFCFVGKRATTALPISHQPQLEAILHRLYEANGNRLVLLPSIKISNETRKGAAFLQRSNIIEIDQKLIDICAEMGPENMDDALAFVIGHELTHAFQATHHAEDGGFLRHCKAQGASDAVEKEADVNGAFCAYLAGFEGTNALIPQLIDKIYTQYDLKDKVLAGYPSFSERQKTAADVCDFVDQIIQVFELANYLLAFGQYDLAVQCYEQVYQVYRGAEICNNLGVCYTLMGMNAFEKNVDPYIFPLELDVQLRLEKPDVVRGGDNDLTPDQWQKRGAYLTAAENYFKDAIKLNYSYLTAELNLLCAYTLNGKAKETLLYAAKKEMIKKVALLEGGAALTDKVALVLALAKAYLADPQAAADFRTLSSSRQLFVSKAAAYNLAVISGEKQKMAAPAPCKSPVTVDGLVDGVKLHRPPYEGAVYPFTKASGLELSIVKKPHSVLYCFKKGADKVLCLQKISASLQTAQLDVADAIATPTGFISSCAAEKTAYRYHQKKGKIVEWAKYYQW